MDSKQLLISSINLLYLESTLPDTTNNSRKIVRKILEYISIPDGGTNTMTINGDLVSDLKYIVEWMMGKEENYRFEPATVLQKIKSTSDNTKKVAEILIPVIRKYDLSLDDDFQFITKLIQEIKDDIRTFHNNIMISDTIRKLSRDIEFSKDPKRIVEIAKNLMLELEPLTHNDSNALHRGITDSVDFGDSESIQGVLTSALSDLNSGGILKTDIQALNDMFCGGFWPGKTYCGSALQHGFKSTMMMVIIRGIISCNKPHLVDPNKKPLILRISSENSSSDDTMWFYKNLMELETGKKVDIKSIDPVHAGNYVSEWVKKSGFTFKNYKVNPSNFSVPDLLAFLGKLISNGYEIKLFVMDYLSMLDKAGLSGDNSSDRIRDMFRRVKNFAEVHHMVFLTPHQISTEAKKLKRADNVGVACFVKEVAGKGYSDGCTRLDQEIDGDFYLDRTKMMIDGVPRWYLEIASAKHRIPIMRQDKDMYFVLPFYEIGTIRPDINGKSSALSRPGGDWTPTIDMDDDL